MVLAYHFEIERKDKNKCGGANPGPPHPVFILTCIIVSLSIAVRRRRYVSHHSKDLQNRRHPR